VCPAFGGGVSTSSSRKINEKKNPLCLKKRTGQRPLKKKKNHEGGEIPQKTLVGGQLSTSPGEKKTPKGGGKDSPKEGEKNRWS